MEVNLEHAMLRSSEKKEGQSMEQRELLMASKSAL